MKKRKAQEINHDTRMRRRQVQGDCNAPITQQQTQDNCTVQKEYRQTDNHSNQEQFKLEVKLETLEHLVSDNKYEEEDIAKVSEYLMHVHKYDFKHQFAVINKVKQLQDFLHRSISIITRGDPVFILYDVSQIHWVTICIVELQNDIIFMYKDPLGEDPDPKLQNALMEVFFDHTIILRCHSNKEQDCDVSCGAISLRNFEIMMTKLKLNKRDFIDNFENTKFCPESEVEGTKRRFQKDLQKYIAQEITGNIMDLTTDEEFKSAISEFINMCLKYKQISELSEQYSTLVENEMANLEKDPNYRVNTNNIENAMQKLLDHPDIQSLKDQINYKQKNTQSDDVEQTESKNTSRLKIEEKFPEQMQKFTKIFTVLAQTVGDENREETLKLISEKLNIDYNKIKQFFEIKKKEAKEEIQKTTIVESKDISQIMKNVPSFSQKRLLDTKEIKTLEQLLAEIVFISNINDSKNCQLKNFPIGKSREYYKKIYENNAEILELENDCHKVKEFYSQWKIKSMEDIYNWSKSVKGYLQLRNICQALGIMDRANELVTGGHRLRDSQILSVLIFIRSKRGQGRLSQILTGEGKTVIVSLLAALKVLCGEKVDIITSNQVLAECAVKDREDFYGLLNISVTSNKMDESYVRGAKTCYTADIVYGSIGNFQFDYLRDTFEGLETRAGRRFENVILDEVDSMLIDNGGYIAKLAGPFPGIVFLKYIYIKIWQELHKAEQNLHEDLEKKLQKIGSELKKKGESGNISEEALQQEYESYMSEQISSQLDELKAKIKASNPTKIDFLPEHLKQYATNMEDKWIDRAIYAKYQCTQNEQYVIKSKNNEGIIVPVDYENTGVTLRNTIWSDGLHQFIQLKHNLSLTPESLTTSFISNIGYIKLYNNRLYGLTGTLGSSAEQKLLSKAYNIDYAKIPTYKQKKFEELPGVVVKDKHWKNFIAVNSITMALRNRSVLIICKTINDLQVITRSINAVKKLEGFKRLKVKTYPDEDSSKIVDVEIGSREIIIATNIAGRGTDLKTSPELEKNGGLHVCLSFLPVNQRVEDQAFGRTSRQGNSGTAQLIVKRSDLQELGIKITPNLKFVSIKEKRDEQERLRLLNIENKELTEIDFQDNLFKRFSNLYREFKGKAMDDVRKHFLAKDLKEHWAFWLNEKDFRSKDLTGANVDEEFANFMGNHKTTSILGKKKDDKYLGGQISHNPYYSITEAEHFLNHGKIKQAETAIKHAIKLSGKNELLYSAYMKLFEIEIEKGCQLRERFMKAVKEVLLINLFTDVNKNEKYKSSATDSLKEAKNALRKEICYIKKNFFGKDPNKSEEDDSDTSATPTNLDFINILISEDNPLIRDIKARLLSLEVFEQHAQALLDQINENPDKSIAMNARIPDYLRNLDDRVPNEKGLKDSLRESTLAELKYVGLDTIYSLKEIHDVPRQVINRAQGQIAAGLSAIGIGIAFPPSMICMSRLASTLISEGVCDIITELISQGGSEFNERVYMKSKCISYGISLLTMGLDAILTCTDLLNRAIKACKSLSTKLKNCPIFSSLCKRLAGYLDKLTVYLKRMKCAAQIAKLKKTAQVSKMQLFYTTVSNAGKDTLKGVVGSIVSEKIVTRTLEETLGRIKPVIEKQVEKTVRKELSATDLRVIRKEDMYILITEILIGTYGEMAVDVLKEIALGMLRHCNNFTIKITSLAIDSAISIRDIIFYTETFCKTLKKQLKKTKTENNSNADDTEEKIKTIIVQVTEKVYSIIMQLAGKYTNTFIVDPIMKKLWNFVGGVEEKPSEDSTDDSPDLADFSDIIDAYEELNLEPGSTMDDIKTAYEEAVRKNQSEASSGKKDSTTARKNVERLTEAYQLLTELHTSMNRRSTSRASDDNTFMEDNDNEAHKANIEALSRKKELYIIVNKIKPDGEIERVTFGEEFKDNGQEPVVLDYFYPNDEYEGHYASPKEMQHVEVIPTGSKNCFYDNVAAQLRARGCNITSQELRDAANHSDSNIAYYNEVRDASKVLRHPLTLDLYIQMHGELLVGGDIRHYPEDADSSEAEKILYASQGKSSEAQVEDVRGIPNATPAPGHPLSHVLCSNHSTTPAHSNATCVENLTKTYKSTKTALKQQQMNSVMNEIMHMECYNDIVNLLNMQALEVELTVPADKLNKNRIQNYTVVRKGQHIKTDQTQSYKVIIGHHAGTLKDKEALPHIKTVYPSKIKVDDIKIVITSPRQNPDQNQK